MREILVVNNPYTRVSTVDSHHHLYEFKEIGLATDNIDRNEGGMREGKKREWKGSKEETGDSAIALAKHIQSNLSMREKLLFFCCTSVSTCHPQSFMGYKFYCLKMHSFYKTLSLSGL